ncbi:MAG: Fis family transcriptional regulator [Marmoricola sp.]|jgi:transcriptional regulator of acetoin/glycerol metabolism|nr:Fis family transcriptional regulator [Marmoricola sp.]
MAPSSAAPRPVAPAQRVAAADRVRFLTEDSPAPRTVRDTILASWRRSQAMRVAADKIEMRFEPDIHLDTRLTRSAQPVLRNLSEQLQGQSVSVILTDQTGLVLSRLTGDGELERHLDRVLLAPGFNYAEEFVGTNGIGTALEVGGPAHVFGHEHYAENLEELACAGVPIHHPVTGRLVGAVDLTCWRKDAGTLLLTLAKTTAAQIRQALLTDASASQLELFQDYLRACNRRTGIVFAMNSDVVMLNDHARASLEPADQSTLLAQAAESMATARRGTVLVELPSGVTARMYCRRVGASDAPSGVVAHVVLDRNTTEATHARELRRTVPLPSLVGSGPPWLHACQEVERVFRSGEWLAVEGEPGVGKLAVLRAVQLRRQPVGRLELLEARNAASDPEWLAGARQALTGGAETVVFRHVDELSAPLLRSLAAALQDARAKQTSPTWVAVTLAVDKHSAALEQLLRLFPSSVELPPLRLHLEDLPPLVTGFLSRHGQAGQLTCSPEAMRLLMRMSWPGNALQLHDLLRAVTTHRRSGSITAEDLPPEVHAVSRRVLSPLEAMERDAIVKCLNDAHGNKLQAARSLGMSRATIYRKIHDYGIVPPTV